MRDESHAFIILKTWNEVFPDLDYRSLEAMYSLIDLDIEVALRVKSCEYLKRMSGQPGYVLYWWGWDGNDDLMEKSDSYTVIFPLLHNKKQDIRREWVAHFEKVEGVINKAWIMKFYEEHPEWKKI